MATITRTVLLALDGEFDITDRAELEEATVAAVTAAERGRVVVDVGGVSFIDSEAVAALIVGYQAASAAGCEYRLTGARGMVRRIFEIAGLLELIGEAEAPAGDA